MKVSIKTIIPNPYNARTDFGDLSGLKTSIEKNGLFQPLMVREKKRDRGYELIFGGRRLSALIELGYNQVDVEMREVSDEDMSVLALCENIHRKDLNPVETARAYRKGLDATKLSIHAFAEIIGESDVKISSYLSTLSLPSRILDSQSKYSTTQLISLGKLNTISSKVRIMLENVIKDRDIPAVILKEVTSSCAAVFAANLPHKRKTLMCGDIIYQDYSQISSRDYGNLREYTQGIIDSELRRYHEQLMKTKKARQKSKSKKKRIKSIKDVTNPNKELEKVGNSLRSVDLQVQKASRRNYYAEASKRSQGKFRTSVNRLVSHLENMLGEDE
jgi:ParB/RepB/Spo0J family partition protein